MTMVKQRIRQYFFLCLSCVGFFVTLRAAYKLFSPDVIDFTLGLILLILSAVLAFLKKN